MEKLNVKKDYPLADKRPELILTPTGKKIDEITMEHVLEGNVRIEDCRISDQTLEYQAQIAESAGNRQMAANLRRAAELTSFSDERVLEIYGAMRPFRSTKEELFKIAEELEAKGAVLNAAFVRQAGEVYEKRKKLKGDK
ncbi:MAG TPA: diol dehydratase small subunit [Anaerovoracaceae bacterium]|nr:diol dehydratase small subunit [Anaerovoracaceae bacterium]